MADTGNPWFIPFAEPSDLVRDWPALSSAVGTAVAAGLSAAGNAGIGSNVVQAVKLDTFTTTSTSFVDIPDLSATITPSSDTAKILVVVDLKMDNTSGAGEASYAQIVRDSTAIYVGNAAGSRVRALGFTHSLASTTRATAQISGVFLDDPLTASAITYKVQARASASTATVNRSGGDDDISARGRTASSITVIEVKA